MTQRGTKATEYEYAGAGAGVCPSGHALHWNSDHSKTWCQGCLRDYPSPPAGKPEPCICAGPPHTAECLAQHASLTINPPALEVVTNKGYDCDLGCEACDKLAEAFEAMREALRFWQESGLDILRRPKLYRDAEIQVRVKQAQTALAIAVRRGIWK